jgi:hypothetical protein
MILRGFVKHRSHYWGRKPTSSRCCCALAGGVVGVDTLWPKVDAQRQAIVLAKRNFDLVTVEDTSD